MLYPSSRVDNASGVNPILAPQSTEAAAAQATEVQSGGDEFTPKPNPDVVELLKQLKVIEKECTSICDKLYMAKTPLTWEEREDLHEELEVADKKKWAIQAQLNDIYDASESEPGAMYSGDAKVIE